MGGCSSHIVAEGVEAISEHGKEDFNMTEAESAAVIESWKQARAKCNLQEMGQKIMLQLIANPAIKDAFKFRHFTGAKMLNHASFRLMAVAVARELERLIQSFADHNVADYAASRFSELGVEHARYIDVRPEHFRRSGLAMTAILNSLRMTLGRKFTSEVDRAWTKLLSYAFELLAASMVEQRKGGYKQLERPTTCSTQLTESVPGDSSATPGPPDNNGVNGSTQNKR